MFFEGEVVHHPLFYYYARWTVRAMELLLAISVLILNIKKRAIELFFRCEIEISVYVDITPLAKCITEKDRTYLFEPDSRNASI